MIIGVGIDIISIDRFIGRNSDDRWLNRVFSAEERQSLPDLSPKTLASRFAAKEAVFKALGITMSLGNIRDVCILRAHGKRPLATLFGEAKDEFDLLNGTNISISISHEKKHAIALAILDAF